MRKVVIGALLLGTLAGCSGHVHTVSGTYRNHSGNIPPLEVFRQDLTVAVICTNGVRYDRRDASVKPTWRNRMDRHYDDDTYNVRFRRQVQCR